MSLNSFGSACPWLQSRYGNIKTWQLGTIFWKKNKKTKTKTKTKKMKKEKGTSPGLFIQ